MRMRIFGMRNSTNFWICVYVRCMLSVNVLCAMVQIRMCRNEIKPQTREKKHIYNNFSCKDGKCGVFVKK